MTVEREALERLVASVDPLFESLNEMGSLHLNLARALAHGHAVLGDGSDQAAYGRRLAEAGE